MTISTPSAPPSTLPNSSVLTPSAFVAAARNWVTWESGFAVELVTIIGQMNAEFTATYLDGDGVWSTKTGAKTAPKIYTYDDKVWLLHQNVADITAETPATSNSNYYLIGGSLTDEIEKQTLSSSGGAVTWDLGAGNAAEITLTENTTITLSGEPSGNNVFGFVLKVTNDSGDSGYTLGFAGTTVETEGSAGLPALSEGVSAVTEIVGRSWNNGGSYTIKRIGRAIG